MGELVTYVLLSVLLVFGIYSFWKQSKNKLPTLDLEKIKSQIDAITDLQELQQYAVNSGVDSFLIPRLSFAELKQEIYNIYNIK